MSTQQNMSADNSNDLLWNVAVTLNRQPLNLTGYTPTGYLKASDTTPDSSAEVFTIGSGLAWTNQAGGELTWTIPRADVNPPPSLWYRLDITDPTGAIATAVKGVLVINPV